MIKLNVYTLLITLCRQEINKKVLDKSYFNYSFVHLIKKARNGK